MSEAQPRHYKLIVMNNYLDVLSNNTHNRQEEWITFNFSHYSLVCNLVIVTHSCNNKLYIRNTTSKSHTDQNEYLLGFKLYSR